MKRVFLLLIVLLLGLFLFASKANAASQNIIITEVQTGSANSSSDEFVEIYNISDHDIDIVGWSVYYRSASGTSWTKKATVSSGTIKTKSFFTFASVIQADVKFSSGLSSTGGSLQLRDKEGSQVDLFGWGNSQTSLVSPASLSSAGQSMYRVYDFALEVFANSQNNFSDFDIAHEPTPGKIPEQEKLEQDNDILDYARLELSELYPDPAFPETDSEDEFIEIFNPSDIDVDLSGWKLTDESSHEFLIKDYKIGAGQRLSFYPSETKITLNNSGDSIRLINPNGDISDESENYGSAKEGLSWSKISGVWSWAIEPSPNDLNSSIYSEDFTGVNSSIAKIKKASSKKTVTKNKTKQSKASSKKSLANSNKVKNSNNNKSYDSAPKLSSNNSKSNSNTWRWLLGALGIATISYAIYEYRTEIQLFIKKLKRH